MPPPINTASFLDMDQFVMAVMPVNIPLVHKTSSPLVCMAFIFAMVHFFTRRWRGAAKHNKAPDQGVVPRMCRVKLNPEAPTFRPRDDWPRAVGVVLTTRPLSAPSRLCTAAASVPPACSRVALNPLAPSWWPSGYHRDWQDLEDWEEWQQPDELPLEEQDVLSSVAMLAAEAAAALPLVEVLGEGSFGSVDRVVYQGQDAIRKSLKSGGSFSPTFLWECRVMLEVDGAGGAPRLHALCAQPPAVIQDYAGVRYDLFLMNECSVGTFLRSVVGVTQSLDAVHQRGFVHNDLKVDNITVSGPPASPAAHVIDFGLSTRLGEPFDFEFFGLPRALEEQEYAFFRSPELKQGRPLQASSDVYSVGVLLVCVCL